MMTMRSRSKAPTKSDEVILEIADELRDVIIYPDEVSDALRTWKAFPVSGKADPDHERSEHRPRGASGPAVPNNPSLNPRSQGMAESDLAATPNDIQQAAEAIQRARGRLECLFSLLESAWKASTQSSPS